MSHYRISALDDLRIIPSFIESTYIHADDVTKVYSASHSSLIRRYDHHVVGIHLYIRNICKKCLDKLISRLNGFKAVRRDGILYTRVMRIKGNNVLNTHVDQLLQSQCAVERLAGRAPVLSSLV